MKRLKQLTLKELWQKVKRNWKVQYRFVVKNVDTHEEKLTFRLSLQRIFVVVTLSAIALIAITAMLIAFTPLRVYVPGYTTPDEYKKYKKLAREVENIDKQISVNQQYINNLYRILNDEIIVENEENIPTNKVEKKELTKPDARDWIETESEKILNRGKNSTPLPINQRASIETFNPCSPAHGIVTATLDIQKNHYGIDIKNTKDELVHAIDKGVVIFSGYEPEGGNTIIIQHPGNIISIYQRNSVLLKTAGTQVEVGEPVAKMGNSGTSEQGIHLHFELWYEGTPLNPSDFIFIEK
ncbi:MAG: M23 family metallopeptidase [Bacteroidales bacterium]|nr:M23 family metallopeptidase [Bacteroidales bacterium]